MLEAWIGDGLSLEEMGRRGGRHPSTVSYWLRKHGLSAARADVHRAKGALDRDELARLIDAGLSVRGIAEAAGRSPTSVRYWLREHGLETRLCRDAPARGACAGGGSPAHVPPPRSDDVSHARVRRAYRCLRCQSEQVIQRRRRLKARLVAEAGGSCRLCGYDRYVGALHFHHLDPSTKRFALGGGATRSLERSRDEASRCVLLCSNCHAEVEAGLKVLA